jgi:hypothetical protein
MDEKCEELIVILDHIRKNEEQKKIIEKTIMELKKRARDLLLHTRAELSR